MSLKSIKHNPFKIVSMFEEEIAEYTGAPYAIAVDSCTNALFLSLYYWRKYIGVFVDKSYVVIPKKTYLSVPQAAIHAGFDEVTFQDIDWTGAYQLTPTPIWDSAKRLTSDMYIPGTFMCLSFHIKKQLPIGKGGMILTDNLDAVNWFKQARYEGRSEKNYKDDDITFSGWNMYMTPEEAARGLTLMLNYPKNVPDLNEDNGYRDLTEFTIFKKNKQ